MPRARKMQVAGTQYGEEAALSRAQDQVPAGPAVTDPVIIGADAVPNLTDPTMRPGEPITAGMPFGPGPGPRPGQYAGDPVEARLRALYRKYPNPHIRRMLQEYGLDG